MASTDHDVSLIAEFCQNHNGDFSLLERMVEAAAEAGATHGKIQTIFAKNVAYRPQFEEGLTVDGTVEAIKRPYHEEYERLKGLEVSFAQSEKFIRRCESVGITAMTTCFAREHVAPLAEIGFRSIKVASYDCASFPMLRELAGAFGEVIVSTGATFDDEIEHAASILTGADFAFLHCVTLYPTPLDALHLNRMEYLREFAPRVGFSDHSFVARDGVVAAKAALALGAEIIERHFTVLGPEESRDGPVSIRPEHLRELNAFARLEPGARVERMDSEHPGWRVALGERKRALSHAELLNRDYYRGRFASSRPGMRDGRGMVFNWEEVALS